MDSSIDDEFYWDPDVENLEDDSSLFHFLCSRMGERLLRTRLEQPLSDLEINLVEAFVEHTELRQALRQHLKMIPDIERLLHHLRKKRAGHFAKLYEEKRAGHFAKLYGATMRILSIKSGLENYDGSYASIVTARFLKKLQVFNNIVNDLNHLEDVFDPTLSELPLSALEEEVTNSNFLEVLEGIAPLLSDLDVLLSYAESAANSPTNISLLDAKCEEKQAASDDQSKVKQAASEQSKVKQAASDEAANEESNREEALQFDILEPKHIQLNFCTTHAELRSLLQQYSFVHEATQQVYEDVEEMKRVVRLLPAGHQFSKMLAFCFQILTSRADYLLSRKLRKEIQHCIPCGMHKSLDVMISRVDDIHLVQFLLTLIHKLEEMELGPGWVNIQTDVRFLYGEGCDDAERIAMECEVLGYLAIPYCARDDEGKGGETETECDRNREG